MGGVNLLRNGDGQDRATGFSDYPLGMVISNFIMEVVMPLCHHANKMRFMLLVIFMNLLYHLS